MPANTFLGNIVQGAGGVVHPSEQSIACEAFKAAVKEWCKKKNVRSRKRKSKSKQRYDKRGGFNDFFYRELKKRDPKTASKINREVAGIFSGSLSDGTRKYLGTAQQVAAGRAVGGASSDVVGAAGYVTGIIKGQPGYGATGLGQGVARGADKMRGAAMGGVFRKGGGAPDALKKAIGGNIRFQDGVLKGQVIELKGPGDSPRPGQLEDANLMSKPKSAVVIDCESCGAPHKNGCPKYN